MRQPAVGKYPIGIQTFSELREGGYLYIDKTGYVHRMAHSNGKYLFLGRPRRFGKSLLTSTLHAYFEGRKELFSGLAAESLETEWTRYPVLHFDMSLGKHRDRDALLRYLHSVLRYNEERLGLAPNETEDTNVRLAELIRNACRKTGRKVVVLVDEYDAPLLDVAHEEGQLPALRNVMRNFYSPLKACDPYLRFVFLTGITKFSQLSIFSELNNIRNISMDEEYAAVCGITEEELRTQMDADLGMLSARLRVDRAEAFARLKANYDGYHFTWPSPDIYNPYSLLNAFDRGKIDAYWFESGTPTYLIEMMRRFGMSATRLGERFSALASDFDAPTDRLASIIPLLYQSGYFTIKDGDPLFGAYTLGLPNREVRIGLMKSLIPYYLTPDTQSATSAIITMARCLYNNDMDGTLQAMRTYHHPLHGQHRLRGPLPTGALHHLQPAGHVHGRGGPHSPGRVDVVMRTRSTLYIIELKLDKSAGAALRQIDLKDYPDRFALCGLPVMKVGISFDSEKRTIGDWKIEEINLGSKRLTHRPS